MNLIHASKNSPQIDPSHPLARCSKNELHKESPSFATSIFKLSLYPKALLRPWDDLNYITKVRQKGVSAELDEAFSEARYSSSVFKGKFPGDTRRKKHSLPMSMVIFVPTSLHSSAFIRNKLKSRIREAVRLVVVRGAKVSEEKGDLIDLAAREGISRGSPECQLVLRGVCEHLTLFYVESDPFKIGYMCFVQRWNYSDTPGVISSGKCERLWKVCGGKAYT